MRIPPPDAACAAPTPAIDLRCRRLAPRHVHEVVAFLARLAAGGDGRFFHPHAFTATAVAALAEPGQRDEYHVLTAGREGPVVAYGMLRGWDEGFTVPRLRFAVDGQWRGLGVGRRLVTHLHAIASARGAASVRLEVDHDNLAAIALSRAVGYDLRPSRPDAWLGLIRLPVRPARLAA
ncbi:MAG: N-acetyltransferase family protein [Planctomycetota bacterium]